MKNLLIVDHASGEFYMVDTQPGEIMKTSMDKGGVAANDSKISVKLKDKGGGQMTEEVQQQLQDMMKKMQQPQQ